MAYLHQQKYLSEWDARGYLTSKHCDATQFDEEFRLEREFISSFPDNSLKILEYSGGPCILNLINKAPKASEIVFSDFLESNRKEVTSWLNNDPGAYDWKPAIRHCLKLADSSSGEEEVKKRECMLRDKIKAVVHCDLSLEHIIEEGYEGPYDLVGCEGVLDELSATIEQFRLSVKKMSKLVKKGGHLIVTSDDADSYGYGELEFTSTLDLSEDDVLEAFYEAGFINVRMKCCTNDKNDEETWITIGEKA